MKEKSEAKQVCFSLSVIMIYRNLYKKSWEFKEKQQSWDLFKLSKGWFIAINN